MIDQTTSDKIFTTEQVSEATGVSIPSLKEYLRQGLVKPELASKGKRQRNGYSFKEIVLVRTVKTLSESGVSRDLVRSMILGARLIIQDEAVNPLSLSFASLRSYRPFELGNFPHIVLRWIPCGSITKIGYANISNTVKSGQGNVVFTYKLYSSGKSPKLINPASLSAAQRAELQESAGDMAVDLIIDLNLTKVHFDVRSKLKSMGLI